MIANKRVWRIMNRFGFIINNNYEKLFPRNCPVREFSADGDPVGVCTFYLFDGKTCERHGLVKEEYEKSIGELLDDAEESE